MAKNSPTKLLTPVELTQIQAKRQYNAKGALYKALIETIKIQKKKSRPYYFLQDHDINNVLATLIKNSTDGIKD